MKVLIIYATKNGASREAAQMLTDALGKRVDVSLVDVNDTLPSPSDFDVAIVGGSIRMGKLNSKLKKYIKENKDIPWTSLVVHWIRMHLPMQGTEVRFLVREDSTCQGTKLRRHNC